MCSAMLKKIYKLYDETIAGFNMACRKKCSSCCTCNVTMTSLEAEFMTASLTNQEKNNLKILIDRCVPGKRYIPKMSSNSFARMCMQGKDIPAEENDPNWGRCPMLVDDLCTLYDVRPFGCRALMSEKQCQKNGYAQIPPIILTINNLFLQFIEHADQNGFFGNMSDVFPLFLADDLKDNASDCINKKDNASDCINKIDGKNLLSNEKIAVLMIPQEHRKKIRPILDKLSSLVIAAGDACGKDKPW